MMQKRPHGTTLLELLVAALIGVMISGAVFTLVMTSKQNMLISSALSKNHYNGELATHHIKNTLMHARFEGCKASSTTFAIQGLGSSSNATLPTVLKSGTTPQFPLQDLIVGVRGFEYSSGNYSPAPSAQLLDILNTLEFPVVDGTDILVVYHTSRDSVQVENSIAAGATSPIRLNNNIIDIRKDDYVYIGDCYKGDVFSVANLFTHSGMPELQHAGLEYAYDKTAEVRKAYVDFYYVGESDRSTRYGLPILSLYRWRNGEVSELIRGTLSLQINFSTYDMANNALRFHTPSDPLLNLNETGFVRVGMLVSNISGLKMRETDINTYQVLDETLDPAKHSVLKQYEHHMKKVFTVEVALDNQG